jgi:hypothetical protein
MLFQRAPGNKGKPSQFIDIKPSQLIEIKDLRYLCSNSSGNDLQPYNETNGQRPVLKNGVEAPDFANVGA